MGIEEEEEDMDLGELDLDGIEQVCERQGTCYVPQEKFYLLQNAIIKVKAQNHLGIMDGSMKENKRKSSELSKKSECKSNRVRLAKVGVKLVESGQP